MVDEHPQHPHSIISAQKRSELIRVRCLAPSMSRPVVLAYAIARIDFLNDVLSSSVENMMLWNIMDMRGGVERLCAGDEFPRVESGIRPTQRCLVPLDLDDEYDTTN